MATSSPDTHPVNVGDLAKPALSPLQRSRIALAVVDIDEELRVDYDPDNRILTLTVNRSLPGDDGPVVHRNSIMLSPSQQPKLIHILLHVLGLQP